MKKILSQHNFQTNVLKMQFREQTPTTKRDAPKEVTFIDTEDPTPAEEQLRLQPNTYVHQSFNPPGRGGNTGRGAMSDRGRQ